MDDNTIVPQNSNTQIEKAIKQLGLGNAPVPEALKQHIVDLVKMEDALNIVEKEISKVDENIERAKYKIEKAKYDFYQFEGDLNKKTEKALKNTRKDFEEFGSDVAGYFDVDRSIGGAIGDVLGGILVGSAIRVQNERIMNAARLELYEKERKWKKKKKKLKQRKKAMKEQLKEERRKTAELKLPKIRSVFRIFSNNQDKFKQVYLAEKRKVYSLNDELLDKKEKVFRVCLFLYAKMLYYKELATFFKEIFEDWLTGDNSSVSKIPLFDSEIDDLLKVDWKLDGYETKIKDNRVPIYLITALKDPYISARMFKLELYNSCGIDLLKDTITISKKREPLPEAVKNILVKNPFYMDIKKVSRTAFSFVDIIISIMFLTVFGALAFFQAHYLGKIAFVTLPLTGWCMSVIASICSCIMPFTKRELYIQELINKQTLKF